MKTSVRLLLLFALLIISSSLVAFASEYSGKCGDSITWTLDTSSGEFILSGTGEMADYTIANNATANTPWYNYRSYITTVEIADGITSIGASAFYDCDGITSIDFPSSVKRLGKECFRSCAYLEEITVPDTVTTMENGVFYGCIRLSSAQLGSGIKKISSETFRDCTGLSYVFIPSTVTEIESSAFWNCSYLSDICIPEGVTYISSNVFGYCTSLMDISLPWSLDTISNSAFSQCSSLASVTIPKSVTSIGVGSFNGCAEDFVICGYADTRAESFAETYGIAFETITSTDGYCGKNLTWEFSVDSGRLSIEGFGDMYDFELGMSPWYEHRAKIENVVISADVTGIGAYAFYNCYPLEDISISDNITHIGRDTFYGTAYFNDSSNWGIAGGARRGELYIDGCLIDVNDLGGDYEVKDGTRLIADYAFVDQQVVSIIVPESVRHIGCYAFADNPITEIDLPEDLATIGEGAFQNCTSIESIIIPDGVKVLSKNIFKNCSSLTSCTIPKTLERIEEYAFGYTGIESLVLYNTVSYIGTLAFGGCYSMTSLTVYSDNVEFGYYVFDSCWDLVLVGHQGSSIEDYATANSISFVALGDKCSHDFLSEVISIATCTQEGHTKYTCLKCGYSYGIVSAVIGHTPLLKSSQDPTCTEDGYSVTECSRCGDTKTTIFESFGHSYGDWIVDIEPMPGVSGEKHRVCSACGAVETLVIEALPDDRITGTCGEQAVWYFDESTGELEIAGSGAMTDYNSASATPWSKYAAGIKSVVIGKNITAIGKYAFASTSITSVTFPDGIITVGAYSFSGCASLKEVVFNESITTVGIRAFENCAAITKVDVPNFDAWCSIKFATAFSNPVYVAKSFYHNGKKVTEIVISEGVTAIKAFAFRNSDIEMITIPASVLAIDSSAFAYCNNLSITGYGETAAETYAKENGITFFSINCGPNLYWNVDETTGVLKITGSGNMFGYTSGYNAPWYPSKAKIYSIELSDDVTGIGKYAFYYCSKVESIVLPEGVTYIDSSAFRLCTSLKSITIPQTVNSIASNAFYGCSNILIKGYSGSYAETFAFENGFPFYAVDTDVASGVCGEALTWYYDNNTKVLTISGNGEMTDYTETVFASWNYFVSDIKSVVFGEGVTIVGNYAFTGCTALEEVTFSRTVTRVNMRAFQDCKAIKKIHIPDFETWCNITFETMQSNPLCYGKSFYINGEHVTEAVVPDSITELKSFSFRCADLVKLTVPKSVVKVGESVFTNCENITVYGYGETAVEAYAKEYQIPFVSFDCGPDIWWELDKTTGTLTITGSGRLYNYTQGFNAPWFSSAKYITSVVFDGDVTNIGDYMFYYCVNLKDVTIPDSVTAIGKSAFRICKALTNVTIHEEVSSIGTGAFYGCSELNNVYIKNPEAIIGNNAFASCPNLTINGYEPSTAKDHATANNIPFKVIVDCEHELVLVSDTATCTENGIATYQCSACDYTETSETEALGHDYESTVTDPTCTETGFTTHVCNRCSHSYTDSETEALGHDYKSTVTEPTCTEAGFTTHVCNRCSHSYTDSETEALGHDYESTVTEPTCTESGYTTHNCTRCKDSYTDNETPATGHSFKVTENTSTCIDPGTVTSTCSACGEIKTKKGELADHKYEIIQDEYICTKPTYSYKVCSVCNNKTVVSIKPAVGHTFGEWITDKEATETENGMMYRECSVCHEREEKIIEALGQPCDAVFSLTSTKAKPGDTVKLTLSLKTLTKVNSIAITDLSYDSSVLEFVGFSEYESIEAISALPPVFDSEKGNIVVAFADDIVFDGVICILEFKIREDAEAVSALISATPVVKLNSESISASFGKAQLDVYTLIKGDIDNDGDVDLDDAVLLFCNSMLPEEYPVEYSGNMDFTNDGVIDLQDALALFRYSMLPDIYPLD